MGSASRRRGSGHREGWQHPGDQVTISVPGVTDGTEPIAICWNCNGNSCTIRVRVVNGVVYLTVVSSGPIMIMVHN